MIDAMKMKRSIYFATLQGYVIFETSSREMASSQRILKSLTIIFYEELLSSSKCISPAQLGVGKRVTFHNKCLIYI